MTREAKADLAELHNFVRTYRTDSLLNHHGFLAALKLQHNSYLAILTFCSEIVDQSNRGLFTKDVNSLAFLNEAASDIGSALFLWIQGAYKGSKLMLRSSIETFVKGLCCESAPYILTTKSVFEVFEIAERVTVFQDPFLRAHFKALSQIYSKLCRDAHTAATANMGKVGALGHFPRFNESQARAVSVLLQSIASRELVCLCGAYNTNFHKMHHRNREIIIDAIPPRFRRRIQNID